MSCTTTNMTEDAIDTLVATLSKNVPQGSHENVRISVYGDFGGGTVTFNYSLDGGTNKIPFVNGIGGSAVSFTENASVDWSSTVYNGDTPILLYATLSGATSPDLTVRVVNPWSR